MTAQPPKHFIRLQDLSDREVEDILDLSSRMKQSAPRTNLSGRTVGLLFFRGSLRTRTSLVAAVQQLGGNTVNLTASSDFWDLESRDGAVMDGAAPEHIRDAAAVMSKYVSALAIRPKAKGSSWDIDREDEGIRAWAKHSRVPVINMESTLWHPLQALADLLTLRECLGELSGKRLAIAWTRSPTPAGHSVVNSILLAALRVGMHVSVAHPPGYDLDPGVVDEAQAAASARGLTLELGQGLEDAVEGAQVVYARSWSALDTYGNPTLAASRIARMSSWSIDETLMARGDDSRLMHPMPVRRNLEVSDEVLDGPRSLLYDQAENRLHTQKGLLSILLRS